MKWVQTRMVEMKQISRAVGSRVPHDRTVGRSPRDRRHSADMGRCAFWISRGLEENKD